MRFNYLAIFMIGNFIFMALHIIAIATENNGLEPYQGIIRDAAVEYGGYADAILPDAENKCLYADVTLNNKDEIVDSAISWVKGIVKEEWLIENIQTHARFLKNDKNNIQNSREYNGILFDYEIHGNRFVIQDSSNRISVLINMPSSTNVSSGGEQFVKYCLKKYIKATEEMIEKGEYKLKVKKELSYGYIQEPKDISLSKTLNAGVNWETMHILTDGKGVIFISFEGLSRKIIGRSGMRTQMKETPIKKRFYPSRLPSLRNQRENKVVSQNSTNETNGIGQ